MSKIPKNRIHLLQGALAFILGAMFFSLSTVFVKYLASPPWNASPLIAAFFRFFIGYLATGLWAWFKRIDIKPLNSGLVVWRGVLNTVAVVLFYSAAQFTTITNTNLLNLMYPAWMLLAGPLVTRESSPRIHILFLVLTLAGAWFVTNSMNLIPNSFSFNIGDILAFGSGIVAAFGIAVLRQARKYDGTTVVVFWLFAIGSVVTFIPALFVWNMPPDIRAWLLVFLVGIFGFVGQLLITYGYRWVTAAQGSLLSGSGILFGAVFGVMFFADPMTVPVLLGGLLIFVSIVGVSGIIREIREPSNKV